VKRIVRNVHLYKLQKQAKLVMQPKIPEHLFYFGATGIICIGAWVSVVIPKLFPGLEIYAASLAATCMATDSGLKRFERDEF
jgi:hypothetical protein